MTTLAEGFALRAPAAADLDALAALLVEYRPAPAAPRAMATRASRATSKPEGSNFIWPLLL